MPDHVIPVVLALAVAYVAGSIPSAYIAGKSRGIDLRKHGSGNLGATNVARVLGARMGILVFLVDALKGFLPVYFLPQYITTPDPQLFTLALGAAAILGHVRPIFLGWQRGGKGVATATGVFVGVAPVATVVALVVWLVVFGISRYVSLGSLCAAAVLPLAVALTGHPPGSVIFAASVLVAIFVFVTHRANISRLLHGAEHRFGRPRRHVSMLDPQPPNSR
jgi:glycerol-3-phosphate acyltransferase PlsY